MLCEPKNYKRKGRKEGKLGKANELQKYTPVVEEGKIWGDR
jgi:hypothetical protein